jgi:hypothetical protein
MQTIPEITMDTRQATLFGWPSTARMHCVDTALARDDDDCDAISPTADVHRQLTLDLLFPEEPKSSAH